MKGGLSGGFGMNLDEKMRKSTECLSALGAQSLAKSSLDKTTSQQNLAAAAVPVSQAQTQSSSQIQTKSQNSEQIQTCDSAGKSIGGSSLPPSGHLREELASSIDNTLAKVMSSIKTLDQIHPNPATVGTKSSDKPDVVERPSLSAGTTVPILVKPSSPTSDNHETSTFPNFGRSKTKASTLPKVTANAEDMKTFGSTESATRKTVDLKTRSLTYAEGNAVCAAIAEQDSPATSSTLKQTDAPTAKDEDGGGSSSSSSTASQVATRLCTTLPRTGQAPIPAAIPTVPVTHGQPSTPTGTSAPLVPPKPTVVKKPVTGGASPLLPRPGIGDNSKAAVAPKK
jgi:hypothetical protein